MASLVTDNQHYPGFWCNSFQSRPFRRKNRRAKTCNLKGDSLDRVFLGMYLKMAFRAV
jgi:hypothetical protein